MHASKLAPGSAVLQPPHGVDTRRIAPVTLVIHAITEDVPIDTSQPDVIGLEVPPRLALMVLVDQHRGMYGCGAGMPTEVDDGAGGVPVGEGVSDEQHAAVDAGNFRLALTEPLAAAGLIAIAPPAQIGHLRRTT